LRACRALFFLYGRRNGAVLHHRVLPSFTGCVSRVQFQIRCHDSDPSGANFTVKIAALGWPKLSVVKLSLRPAT